MGKCFLTNSEFFKHVLYHLVHCYTHLKTFFSKASLSLLSKDEYFVYPGCYHCVEGTSLLVPLLYLLHMISLPSYILLSSPQCLALGVQLIHFW